ncbi:MAG: Glu/Leu/Phe/Val dehydrogenase [Holophagales bacterium]|nr:Glu/Leu/Phe/Val dehydrogenase [Holophagales bacterium]
MSRALELAAEHGHERVTLVQEPEVGLRAVLAIHSTALGPAVGGTRMRPYPSFDDAIVDALELSRAMTLKNAYAGLPYGGGKAVIFGEPLAEKTPALLAAYGRAVDELGGRFLTGGDMGVHVDDLAWIGRSTRHVGGAPEGVAFDSSDLTALGVASALAALSERLAIPAERLTVAIQGTGAVGARLARLLAERGARLFLADAVPARAEELASELGAEAVPADAILDVSCDVFSPNGAGGVLDEAALARLSCRAICGAANNPLADPLIGFDLAARGVVYAPDFVVSAGGVLSLLLETGATDEAGLVARVERLGADLVELLDAAEAKSVPPFRLAERRVAERLASARRSADR